MSKIKTSCYICGKTVYVDLHPNTSQENVVICPTCYFGTTTKEQRKKGI
jgi:uncharacterized protein (DUF2225 family)